MTDGAARTNGNVSRTVSWIMGVIAAVFIALASFLMQAFQARLDKAEQKIDEQSRQIARLETNQAAAAEMRGELIVRVSRIERKLDDVLYRRRNTPSNEED